MSPGYSQRCDAGSFDSLGYRDPNPQTSIPSAPSVRPVTAVRRRPGQRFRRSRMDPRSCQRALGSSAAMSRHTTFRFCLNPSVEQSEVLARHAGAARFAFNQCLAMVKTQPAIRRTVAGGSVLTGVCRRSWSPRPSMAMRSALSPPPKRLPPDQNDSDGWRNRCRARRKDQSTVNTALQSYGATIIVSQMCAVISCIGCPTNWSRPTTGSSLKT